MQLIFHGCFQPNRSLKPNLHPRNPPPHPPLKPRVRIPVVPASAPNGPFPVTSSSSTAPPTVAPTAWCGSPAAGPAAVDPGAAYASTRPRSKAAWAPPVPSGKETFRYRSYPTRNGKGTFRWLKKLTYIKKGDISLVFQEGIPIRWYEDHIEYLELWTYGWDGAVLVAVVSTSIYTTLHSMCIYHCKVWSLLWFWLWLLDVVIVAFRSIESFVLVNCQ